MRIAVPIHSFEPGGVERVALRLAARWHALGEDVTVVLGREEGRCKSAAPHLSYRTFPEPFHTGPWETPWLIWCLFRFLRTERVDVLFCPGNTYSIVCVAMRLLLGDRCPPVVIKISNDLQRHDLPAAIRFCYHVWLRLQGRFLDHFVAISEPMKPEIIEELQVDPARVSIIADPALDERDLERLSRRPYRSNGAGGSHFVSLGRLAAQKNLSLMLQAFAEHSWPDDHLTIAGEGPEGDRLQQEAQRLGLAGRISFPGHVDDVPQLLWQADVLVLSSDYEGAPAVVIEALAAGLPIAATDCGASMAWLLQHGRFGVLAPPGDANALGAAMNVARHMAVPKDEMRLFAGNFTLEKAVAAYLAVLSETVRNHSRGDFAYERRRVRHRTERGV